MDTFFLFLSQNFIAVTILLFAILGLLIHESRRGGEKIEPSLATQIVNKQNGLLIDLRAEKEFSRGHISGSINCESLNLLESVLDQDKKDSPVILVCQNGSVSKQAGLKLKKLGFSKNYIIQNGIMGWKAQGLPLIIN